MKTATEFWSQVDTSGECWRWMAGKDGRGYGAVSWHGRTVGAHRVAYMIAHGPIAKGMMIDHVCRVTDCVRPEHLRVVTNKQNLENLSGAYSTSRSGVRGVHWASATGKWQAEVVHNGEHHYLGQFATIREAETVVQAERLRLFTHNEMDRAAA